MGSFEMEKKAPFDPRVADFFVYSGDLILTRILEQINSRVDASKMECLPMKTVVDWMDKNGFLQMRKGADGERMRIPTEKGEALGIYLEERSGWNGTYSVCVYNAEAQQYLYGQLANILAGRPAVI